MQTANQQFGFNQQAADKTFDLSKQGAAQTFDYNNKAAQNTLDLNAMNRTDPFGYSQFERDPNTGLPTGINSGFSGPIAGAADNVGGAFQSQTGLLPSGFDFSSTSAPGILMSGMGTYDALSQDPIQQGQNRISQEIANRGIPINDKIATDLQGNFDRQNALGRQSFFSDLYGRLPGIQQTETNAAIAQGMAPGQQAGQSLGLLSGMSGLIPQAQQPQANVNGATVQGATVGTPYYMGAVNNNYNQQMKQYEANQAGLGNLLKVGGTLAGTVLGGPIGGMIGGGLGGMFNGGGMGGTDFNGN